MAGIAGDISKTWDGLGDLLVTPVDIEQREFCLDGMVKKRGLRTDLIVPVILWVKGSLGILNEGGVETTCLITTGHGSIEEVALAGKILQGKLGSQLGEIQRAAIGIRGSS